ncbi:calcium-binding and coiled-coil domain-containing protein 2 isoform 2-T2 [Porphyrio hochstetteri]
MGETSDDPPTSAVLLDNCHFSQVVFNNVEKFYVPGGDVTCYYTLTQNITPRGKDWVGIFRVGWKTTREYYTFMWAPLPADARGGTTVQQQIQFKAYYLPKDDEYYQFCYVDQDAVVRGASVPFQFRAETEDDILVVTTQGEVEEIELQNKNLLKENEELKASCASLQKQTMDLQEQLSKAQELQSRFDSLRSNTEKLELELQSLKKENKCLKDLDDCREPQLLQLKEQIQSVTSDKECLETKLKAALGQIQSVTSDKECLETKLKAALGQIQSVTSDKECLETKLKTVLDQMDQLQSQVLNYEKEVENLSHMDRDKTEQLESLKEENRQLRVTQQQENLNLMKDLEEQKHLFQSLQAKKNEADEENRKLREENDDLLRQVLQAREVSSFSAASQAHAPIPASGGGSLLFGNPYCVAGANLEAGAASASIRKCPMCDDVFPEDIETSQYEAHVQSHLLDCPLCNETFEKSNKQVFEDHMFCHGLE